MYDTATVIVKAGPWVVGPTSTSSSLVQVDQQTQSDWVGNYGADGYDIPSLTPSLPSYAQVGFSGATPVYLGQFDSSEFEGLNLLQDPGTSKYVASVWASGTSNEYGGTAWFDITGVEGPAANQYLTPSWGNLDSSYTININLTDGLTHQVAIFGAECASQADVTTTQLFQVLDATTGALLETESFQSFVPDSGGSYLVLDLKGDVNIRVTSSICNPMIGGIFFDPVTPAAPSIDNADDDQWDDMNNGEGENVSFPIQASDPYGLSLSYSATGLPPGVSINPGTGLISGTIAQGDDTGTPYDVIVSVSNGRQATTLEFPWAITQDSFSPPPDQTDVVGDVISLPIVDSDANGDPLTFSAEGLPDGLTIDPNTGVISGSPALSGVGMPWQVTIDMTDGTETEEHSFNWTILPTVIPTISILNPGDQTNFTDDVINLSIQGVVADDDELHYSASGLPTGLGIDPDTGIITGMDDDFNAPDGTSYSVTVSITDDYGQAASQTFNWQFNSDPSEGDGGGPDPGVPPQSGGGGTPGPGLPGQHPTTEARNDNFDINQFWANVEKFPGGQAAENWFLNNMGDVQWAYLGVYTYGTFENADDGSSIPVVYIPQRYNEADAAAAFIGNITQSWVTGFAAWSRIPTDGNPDDWQQYVKERTAAMGNVVTTGAELYLSGLSIVNEGVDWVITANEVASSKTLDLKQASCDRQSATPVSFG